MSAALEIVTWMCFHLFYTFSCCFLEIFYLSPKKRPQSEKSGYLVKMNKNNFIVCRRKY